MKQAVLVLKLKRHNAKYGKEVEKETEKRTEKYKSLTRPVYLPASRIQEFPFRNHVSRLSAIHLCRQTALIAPDYSELQFYHDHEVNALCYISVFSLCQSNSRFEKFFLQVTWYLLLFLNLQTSLISEVCWRRMMEIIFCISYPNKVHPGFKSQLHFNYFFNVYPVSLHISPFQIPALHSPSDFLPSCITSPETSFRWRSLTEDRQERKTQVILQSRVTTPPKVNFNFF